MSEKSRAFLPLADLSGANLTKADLSRAREVTDDQLAEARSLKGATMPDGQKYEEWLKDREHSGEVGQDDA